MSLSDWWRRFRNGRLNYRRHEDAYAVDRPALWKALRQAMLRQQSLGRTVWLVAHRESTFLDLQDQLADWNCGYEIPMAALVPQDVPPDSVLDPASVKLILAPLLLAPIATGRPVGNMITDSPLAVMVLDRSFDWASDQQIESFCRTLPLPVELGYLLSLDDPVVADVVDPTSRLVLEQLGMQRHGLITSTMITARIRRRRRQASRRRDRTPSP